MIANHGRIPVWNLLEGDTVIVRDQLVTVHADPVEVEGGHRVSFRVFEILEDDEVGPTGLWRAAPRTFEVKFAAGAEVAFLQTSHIEEVK